VQSRGRRGPARHRTLHLLYGVATANGRRLLADLWPRRHDLRDLLANGLYLLGRRPRPPRFARFGYPEKLEYWAVVWGTLIMGTTGLMIWFKLDVTRFLPRWAIEAATTVHYYEAILACLAIGVWHFYHVIFAPEVYPLNWAWWMAAPGRPTRTNRRQETTPLRPSSAPRPSLAVALPGLSRPVPEAVTPVCLRFANIREVIAKIGVAEAGPATRLTARP